MEPGRGASSGAISRRQVLRGAAGAAEPEGLPETTSIRMFSVPPSVCFPAMFMAEPWCPWWAPSSPTASSWPSRWPPSVSTRPTPEAIIERCSDFRYFKQLQKELPVAGEA